jgi:hypothetical protein
MSLKAALHQYLASKTSVTSLVPAASIVRGKRPAGTALPCVAYTRVSDTDEDHQGGAGGLAMARIQLDIWGTTDPQVDAIRSALRNVFHGLQHTTIGTGGDATAVQSGVIENSTDAIEWPEDGADPARFSCSLDWICWYASTIPTLT